MQDKKYVVDLFEHLETEHRPIQEEDSVLLSLGRELQDIFSQKEIISKELSLLQSQKDKVLDKKVQVETEELHLVEKIQNHLLSIGRIDLLSLFKNKNKDKKSEYEF